MSTSAFKLLISGRSSRYIWANSIKFTTFGTFPIIEFHNYAYTWKRLSSEELKTLDIVFDNAAFVRIHVISWRCEVDGVSVLANLMTTALYAQL